MSIIGGPASHTKKYPERPAARQRTISFLTLFLFTSLVAAVPPDSYAQVAPDEESSPVAARVAVLTLDQAVAIALQNNPDVAGLQAQADAMWAVPSQAGALPDPTLSLNAMNLPTDTFDLDQEPMTQMQVALSQSFPFPGKRILRREAKEHEVDATR